MRATLKFVRFCTNGYRKRICAIILIGLAEVVSSLFFVWFSKIIIDIATGVKTGNLIFYASFLVALTLLQILFRAWDIRLCRMTEVKLGNTIRYNVFSRLLYTRWQDLSSMHSGDMITRIIKDTDDVINVLVTALPLTIVAATQFAGAIVILYILDPMLALILGVGIPLLALFGKLYYRKMRQYTMEVKESESMITSMMEESLLNQIVIRTFELQEKKLNKLDTLQSKLHQSVHKRTKVSIFANLLMGVAFNGGYITAFLWSAFGLVKRSVTFGTVTAYLQLANRIQRPLFDLMRLLPSVISAKTAIERLIYMTGFSQEESKERLLLEGDVTLRIENVTFSYAVDRKIMPRAKPVLSDFSLVVKHGEMVAVMGETGVGKTTLLRLLLALVKPHSGRITLEYGKASGQEAGHVEVSESTRANFVYVPQGGSLFSGTIRDNLLLGNPDATDEELEGVLRIAAAGFVFELPAGIETLLGEGGKGLSEGQAQRIAIARSLLRPGRILLLDEATSALDTNTQRLLLQNLKREMSGRTILFITHQPEVADFCDRVYRLPKYLLLNEF